MIVGGRGTRSTRASARATDGHRAPLPGGAQTARIPRFDFYARARKAFAVVLTGEFAKYGDVILKKGVTPVRAERP